MHKTITEDSESGVVTIGEVRVSGWIDDIAPCGRCGTRRIYHEDYDAYFCPDCNVWLEHTCRDRSCEYCGKRPDHPLPV